MTTTNNTYDGTQMLEIMTKAERAIRIVDNDYRVAYHTARDSGTAIAIDIEREQRRWITREIQRYPMHEAVKAAVLLARPYDWQQMLLEWPHVSQGDKSKIAYTQNEDKGRRDIQTVTSVGKYLNRHFALADHVIRDLVSRYGTASQFKFVHTTAEMIYHLHRGPQSCMVWGEDRGVGCRDGVTRHPYEAYNPKYGWHMAVRIEGDKTMGRALCMTNPDTGYKYYVRTYLRPSNDSSYSQADAGMENWLADQGYAKESSWQDGEKLAYYETRDDFLSPYLDGSDKHVKIDCAGNETYIVVDADGDYICDQTGGAPTEYNDNTFECADCGDDTDEDDGYWVGRYEDSRVCTHCQENNYRYAYSRGGDQYYIHEDDVVYVESQSDYYDVERLSDNNIIELENGEYEHIEEAVEIDGEWYHIDDERICRTEDTDEYMLKDDECWQCEESGNWYTDNCVEWTEYQGKRYHDDYIPQDIADATADKDDDAEDEADATPPATPEPTMLTMDMLWNTHMLWDYSIAMDQVTISMTYVHDGHTLHAKGVYSTEFVNSMDRTEFNRITRNKLCTALVTQAYNNSLAII